jgi:DNA-binding MarR family transcriptional regulator
MEYFEKQLKNSMGTLIGRTSHAILNRLQKRFREEGHSITVEQWQLLINLNNSNDQFHQQLAENTFKEKSTVSRILDGLEQKGLVKRVADTKDRRQKKIRITQKGRNLLEKLRPLAHDVQNRALNGLDMEQLAVCREILLQIHGNVTAGD